ncbi:MAG: dual specificity protein phosphatase family protein [Chloroflexi bacterium]|nr:dual specificity protein phosphatase family protein [Chloroflexota bacterium]MBP7043369.1 dual specificity protein phosphatase family protein [Chloroflexota bacterium]
MIRLLPTPDSYEVVFDGLTAVPPHGRLLAGEYPSAPYPDAAEAKLTRYLDFGVTFFLDLTEAGEYQLREYATAVQAMAAARSQPITHHRQAVPDMSAPSATQMTEILNTLDTALENGETVYVHCFGGIGRTGTVIGCWLVRHGLTGEEALANIAAWRANTPDGYRTSPETDLQRQMVRRWTG